MGYMVEFNLHRVTPSANWVTVTVDMAPDEIEYTVTTGDKKIQQQDSLTALVALYAYGRDESKENAKRLAAFDVERTNGQVRLSERVFSDCLVIGGDFDQLRSALEPILSEIFLVLDQQSSTTEREEALEFLSNELNIAARKLYDNVTSE